MPQAKKKSSLSKSFILMKVSHRVRFFFEIRVCTRFRE